jgi:hypothetical protein
MPSEPLDAHLRDVAAEAPVALEQRRLGTGTCRRERGRETAGAAADHEDVGLEDHVDRAGRLAHLLPGRDRHGLPR